MAKDYFAVKLSGYRTTFFAAEDIEHVKKWVEKQIGAEARKFLIFITRDLMIEKIGEASAPASVVTWHWKKGHP